MPGPPLEGLSATIGPPSDCIQGGTHRSTQCVEVVAPLEKHGEASNRSESGNGARERGVVATRESELGERIFGVGVKACRHEHPRWGELVDHGIRYLVECALNNVAGCSRGERDVDRETEAHRGRPLRFAHPVPG